MNLESIRFDEKGLVPAIIQDARSKEVLTLAYMNKESLEKTVATRETWFFSRSRQELWHKGATSGNTQTVVGLKYDCDQDALLVLVQANGPACHTGTVSCFNDNLIKGSAALREDEEAVTGEASLADYAVLQPLVEDATNDPLFQSPVGLADYAILQSLEKVIAERERDRPEGAYTTYLFEKGVDKILKKVGEEAAEVIIAAKNRDREELKWESADLLYHLLVLLTEQKLSFKEVLEVLAKRHESTDSK